MIWLINIRPTYTSNDMMEFGDKLVKNFEEISEIVRFDGLVTPKENVIVTSIRAMHENAARIRCTSTEFCDGSSFA